MTVTTAPPVGAGIRPFQVNVAEADLLELRRRIEATRCRRSWTERAYSNLLFYNQHDKGGHFAAREQPELLVGDLRAGFTSRR